MQLVHRSVRFSNYDGFKMLLLECNPVAQHFERKLVPKTTILLADDNCSVLSYVSKMLEKDKDSKVVATISNGSDARSRGNPNR